MSFLMYFLAGLLIGPGAFFVYAAVHPTLAVIGALAVICGVLIAGITLIHQDLQELLRKL